MRISREKSLQNGDIFHDYSCFMDFQREGRQKMIVKTTSNPLLHIHGCSRCSIFQIDREYMHIFHIKARISTKNRTIICNNETEILWEKHKAMLLHRS